MARAEGIRARAGRGVGFARIFFPKETPLPRSLGYRLRSRALSLKGRGEACSARASHLHHSRLIRTSADGADPLASGSGDEAGAAAFALGDSSHLR